MTAAIGFTLLFLLWVIYIYPWHRFYAAGESVQYITRQVITLIYVIGIPVQFGYLLAQQLRPTTTIVGAIGWPLYWLGRLGYWFGS